MGTVDINFMRAALDGLALRQEAIANNIANAETPGYRRATVNFESTLRNELASQQQLAGRLGLSSSQSSGTTQSGHLPLRGSTAGGGSSFGRELMGLKGQQFDAASRNDGNSVDMDQEMTNLAVTQIQYAGLTAALATRLRMMRNVFDSI